MKFWNKFRRAFPASSEFVRYVDERTQRYQLGTLQNPLSMTIIYKRNSKGEEWVLTEIVLTQYGYGVARSSMTTISHDEAEKLIQAFITESEVTKDW